MGTGSIGSSTSFWQQDQSYWQQASSNDSSISATDSVINAISSAETSKGKGLASIANQSALNRTDSDLEAAIQSILSGNTGSSSSSSTSSSTSSSSTSPAPATGTGTAVLSTSTSLSTLGIPAGATISVTASGDTTRYTSTGSDTVGDLMQTLNQDLVGNAPVTASLSSSGRLVLTAKNDTAMITVGGIYASNIGFGGTNNNFSPTKGTSSASSTSSSTTASKSTSTSSSTSKSTSTSTSTKKSYTTLASETSSSAASVLSDSGAGGTLVDMLA
jgi:hypothetical protein